MTLEEFLKEVGGKESDIFKYTSDAEALAAVKQDGYNLRYVHNQTPEICLAAVKQAGFALQFVRNQTPEICLAAVKQDGFALQFVHNQTPEICLAAVKENSYALKFIDETIFGGTIFKKEE